MSRVILEVRGVSAEYKKYIPASAAHLTHKIIPYSTALGLILNINGINTRDSDNTVISFGKKLKLCVANKYKDVVVGHRLVHDHVRRAKRGYDDIKDNHGIKSLVTPKERQFITYPWHLIGVESDDQFVSDLVRNIYEGNDKSGALFLGNNECPVDSIRVLPEESSGHWYIQYRNFNRDFSLVDASKIESLTYQVDQMQGLSRSVIVYPLRKETNQIPQNAWVEMQF